MSVQTISIPWSSDESDSIHLTWDTAGIPGAIVVDITSDDNYTGSQRQKNIVFTSSAAPRPSETLTVIQGSDNLVIASFTNTVTLYSDVRGGFPKS